MRGSSKAQWHLSDRLQTDSNQCYTYHETEILTGPGPGRRKKTRVKGLKRKSHSINKRHSVEGELGREKTGDQVLLVL